MFFAGHYKLASLGACLAFARLEHRYGSSANLSWEKDWFYKIIIVAIFIAMVIFFTPCFTLALTFVNKKGASASPASALILLA